MGLLDYNGLDWIVEIGQQFERVERNFDGASRSGSGEMRDAGLVEVNEVQVEVEVKFEVGIKVGVRREALIADVAARPGCGMTKVTSWPCNFALGANQTDFDLGQTVCC